MDELSLFCPAKLNLFLAVTERRADGWHNLVSLMAPLAWGDTLRIKAAKDFSLTCSDKAVPTDESNLVLQAARLFREATGWKGGAALGLEKRIPMGAGLGGGSSDGAAALKALNALAGQPLDNAAMAGLAARLGADCPFFLAGGPAIVRGKGERLETLTDAERSRLRGQRVLVFKPEFGISTVWAYARLVKEPQHLVPGEIAEARLQAWREHVGLLSRAPGGNNFEPVVFAKHLALPALYRELETRFGCQPRLSGSGSASFLLLDDTAPVAEITAVIRDAWGPSAVLLETSLA